MEQLNVHEMRTALYERHLELGAKIVEFGGWLMPLQYAGILHEHRAVRERAGLFDVSHMGRIAVEGEDAEAFLDYLSTNHIAGKAPGTATYTVLPDSKGGCVDDVIVYREDQNRFFIIVNASNRQKDLAHLIGEAKKFRVSILPKFDEEGILAMQGPQALQFLTPLFPQAAQVKPMHFVHTIFQGHDLILSATGYTGAGGFEIYAPTPAVTALWDYFMEKGVEPVGLGARDTLRLEMGYALYGHELSDTIFPNESVSRWTVKWDKGDFLGRKEIEACEESPALRHACGLVLIDKGIAREGCVLFKEGKQIGRVTSGTFSPTLNKAIALALVDMPLKVGEHIAIQIRNNQAEAEVVPLPFLHKS